MKITNLQVKSAIAHDARLSIDVKMHQAKLAFWPSVSAPVGVMIEREGHPPTLVPWGNLREVRLTLEQGDPGYKAPAK
jgi:hypothetical protein